MLNIKQRSNRERQTLNLNRTKQKKNKPNVVESVNRGNGITRQQMKSGNDRENLTPKTWFEQFFRPGFFLNLN
jgi:hypothetical protein